MTDRRRLLHDTADLAADFLESIADRPVGVPVDVSTLRETLGGDLPAGPRDPAEVVANLARDADPGLVASAGPRYFGFVIGGGVPAALSADWLASAWDQNGFAYVMSPAGSVVEETAARWLLDVWGLPADASVGFVTGVTMANFTGLAAARHAVLERAGWNTETQGYVGAPEITVVTGAEAHSTVSASLQMLFLGRDRVIRVPADGQGRLEADALAATLAGIDGPTIVCAQAGNVNTGAFDPFEPIVAAVRRLPNAWLHVDGAFGLWAGAAPTLRHLVTGIDGADSWATDGHKWLNVPYDSGIVAVRDQAAHHAAMTFGAPYLIAATGGERDGGNWVPDSSRRVRGFAIYAALASLGRSGVADLVDRCCRLAGRMADALREGDGVTILNDVVLNQVLVRFSPGAGASDGETDEFTRAVIAAVQRDGTCWLGGTTWHGMAAMRISVSNWMTTDADIDVSAEAILRCRVAVAAERVPV
jgi:glutamate/tyrosine decarboxylase-like PLP-dependent enzyme